MSSPPAPDPLGRLTARQRECLSLAARHWTSKDIARQLDISPKTVDRHVEEAVRKLGAADRAAAVRLLLAAEVDAALPALPVVQQSQVGQGFPSHGDNPHGEFAPVLELAAAGHAFSRGGETTHGQTAADVHLERRTGGFGDSGRHLAAQEGGVAIGTAEAGFADFITQRAPGGDRQYGDPPWGRTASFRTWAPEPARRLGWVLAIAAGLALTAGALVGSFDMLSALHRLKTPPTPISAAGSSTQPRGRVSASRV
jgi:DNA-binding CsgD family transcriptional regulator